MKLCVHDGNTLPDTHKKFYDEIRNSFGFIAKNVHPIIVPLYKLIYILSLCNIIIHI